MLLQKSIILIKEKLINILKKYITQLSYKTVGVSKLKSSKLINYSSFAKTLNKISSHKYKLIKF